MSVKLLSPLVPPAMTTAQRDAIPAGRRPPGSLIWNTSTGRAEMNTGTDVAPVWAAANLPGVGSAGQVLGINPAGSAIAFLAGLELIQYQQPASPAASVDFTSIPQGFKSLLALIFWRMNGVGGSPSLGLRFNGVSSGYGWSGMYNVGGGTPQYPSSGAYSTGRIGYGGGGASDSQFASVVVFIPGYTRAERRSWIAIAGGFMPTGGDHFAIHGGRHYGDANPLTQLSFMVEGGGNIDTGSQFSLYGLG